MISRRIQNTKRNIIFSYVDTIVSLLFTFVSRTIIVYTIGEQYLGLSSLFSSILQVLNMADLGFSSAIIYNLYKPIAENDTKTVCALLNYYKKIYRHVAIIVLVVGVLLSPFIKYLIKGGYPQNINIYVLFYLYLINTVVSYIFWAYYDALLNALQRLDLTKIAFSVINTIQSALQIISLLLFHSYYCFVFFMVIGTIGRNVFVAYISRKRFPQYKCEGKITDATKKDIITRVKGLLLANISSITYTTFDNIILSSFIGLTVVAIYNNYIVIFQAVNQFIIMLRRSMQASVGDSIASESVEKNYHDIMVWQLLYSCIGILGATCMINLYQPFIKMWMGERMLLSFLDVVLISAWFYIGVIQHAFYLYLGGKGFWWEMRGPYICSTITNIVLNILLGKLFGISGIIFSTLFVSVLFGLFWQCSITFKFYFKKSMIPYQIKQLKYSLLCVLSVVASLELNRIINMNSYGEIICRLVTSVLISALVIIIGCRREQVYKDMIKLMARTISR